MTAPAPPARPSPVLVTVPDIGYAVELCIRHESWGVEVDCRVAGSNHSWAPLNRIDGGKFTTRAS